VCFHNTSRAVVGMLTNRSDSAVGAPVEHDDLVSAPRGGLVERNIMALKLLHAREDGDLLGPPRPPLMPVVRRRNQRRRRISSSFAALDLLRIFDFVGMGEVYRRASSWFAFGLWR